MKAYKILRRVKGRLYSAVNQKQLTIRYFKTKVNKPKNGSRLFVFESENDARNWLDREGMMQTHEIWEAEVPNLEEPPRRILWPFGMGFATNFDGFWKAFKTKSHFTASFISTPAGSKLTTSLRLIKKVYGA
jgi:hypothetical protein